MPLDASQSSAAANRAAKIAGSSSADQAAEMAGSVGIALEIGAIDLGRDAADHAAGAARQEELHLDVAGTADSSWARRLPAARRSRWAM